MPLRGDHNVTILLSGSSLLAFGIHSYSASNNFTSLLNKGNNTNISKGIMNSSMFVELPVFIVNLVLP